jgi:hypothetical protein
VEVLAVRNRLYHSAVQSADCGAATQEFLSHFLDIHTVEYVIVIAKQWSGCQFSSIRWRECNEKGHMVYSGQLDYKVVDSFDPSYIEFSGASASPKPRLSSQLESLYIEEYEVGSVAEISIDQASRTIVVRGAAGQTLSVQFVNNL